MSTFQIHHLQREFEILLSRFSGATGTDFVIGVLLLVFALAFLIVGVLRTVEFQDKGFSPLKRRVLVAVHIFGTIIAAVAMALFGLDVSASHTSDTGVLVGVAFLILVPLHIYLGLIRRIRMKDANHF